MSRHAILPLALSFALVVPAAAGDRAPAPAPHCMDARSVEEVVQSDDYTLALRLMDESRFRIDLAGRCPAIVEEPDVRVVSPQGWTCGRPKEAVVGSARVCPIAHVARIDARTFSEHAMQGRRAPKPEVLGSVQVRGERRRGFVGSPSYCINTNHMRGWSEDGKGLLVEVSPVRSGGHRVYRVELGAGCQGLTDSVHLRLVSRVGNAMVCGFAGDEAIFFTDLADAGLAGAFTAPGSLRAPADAGRCPVSEVYPVLPEERELATITPAR